MVLQPEPTALSFLDEVKLEAIKTLLFGALVGIAAFMGNRLLERYKSREALRGEIAKRRAELLGALCRELDQLTAAAGEAYKAASTHLSTCIMERFPGKVAVALKELQWEEARGMALERFPSLLKSQLARIDEGLSEAEQHLSGDAFWLGRSLTATFSRQIGSLREYVNAVRDLEAGRFQQAGMAMEIRTSDRFIEDVLAGL
jgi:hypothetical protein